MQQEQEFSAWAIGGRIFPDYDAIRSGDAFVVTCGPLVHVASVHTLLRVPDGISCKKTEAGFLLYNPQKVN